MMIEQEAWPSIYTARHAAAHVVFAGRILRQLQYGVHTCESLLSAGSLELDLLWEDVSAAEAAHRDESVFVPSSAAAWRLHAMRPRHDVGGWRGFTLGQVHNRCSRQRCWLHRACV